jgi:hypothetical protein
MASSKLLTFCIDGHNGLDYLANVNRNLNLNLLLNALLLCRAAVGF